jgi:hypothetical protein
MNSRNAQFAAAADASHDAALDAALGCHSMLCGFCFPGFGQRPRRTPQAASAQEARSLGGRRIVGCKLTAARLVFDDFLPNI